MFVFVFLSVAIHSVFLYSVFDVYFKSPIIHGMTPYATPLPAPAKRLVLIVADGLRADKFFEVNGAGESNSPFLRNIITNVGSWGISHTRVPTESRPGHVALIAGIYEDVSAVAKGWKENPVEFDSIFNESRYTWAWGSPDILPMFTKGASKNIFIDTYTSSEEDFAGANPHYLDIWVFQKLEKFFEDAKENTTLKNMILENKIVFFLHLLGMDISGHSYKPGSKEYVKNIKVVDEGVKKCVELIENFYGYDEKTAYIFTSDHGMTNWGSHGSGDMQETYTPFVTWGAGIRGPMGEGKDIYHDGLSADWKLAQIKRVDINQVDIAPLMAALLGIPFPVNSLDVGDRITVIHRQKAKTNCLCFGCYLVILRTEEEGYFLLNSSKHIVFLTVWYFMGKGTLPVEYLGTDWPHKALTLLTNARQILAHYQRQMLQKKENTLPIFFWHFKDLSVSRQSELLSMIDTLLKQNRYKDAIQVGLKIIELALKGLAYYQKHDRIALSISIFLGFLGWISYLIVLILQDYTSIGYTSLESSIMVSQSDFSKVKCIMIFHLLDYFIATLLHVQNVPIMYYAYFLLPIFLWLLVSLKWHLILSSKAFIERRNNIYKFFGIIVLIFVSLELMVISFFQREILSFVLWAISTWPFFSPLTSPHKKLCICWCISSLLLSVFPFLPVIGRESNYNLVILAGWLVVLIVGYCARRPETGLILNNRQTKREPHRIVMITALQVVILCIATYTVRSTAHSIATKDGLPVLNQIISWFILFSSIILPLFGSQFLLTRLLNVTASLFASYLLLCISHEGLFCLILCIQMFLWLSLEHHQSYNYAKLQDLQFASFNQLARKTVPYQVYLSDLRRAYFFIFFILLAFFGTGNIASINSFDPTSVYCFLTIFSPYIMGFLILLKMVIPFILVSCTFRAITVTLKISARALFLLILLMSDFMSLHFFFFVKDTGSWLDIGTSLSHYIISMTITIFIMLLYGLAWLLTSCALKVPYFNAKRHLL